MAVYNCLGGFNCSRNVLIAINALYIVVSFILIGLAAYAKAVAYIVDYSVMGGIIACGVFLLIIASVGVIGSVLHHQVTLFFYMVILSLLFIVQFIVACACLTIGPTQQQKMFEAAWNESAERLHEEMQAKFDCCGSIKSEQNFINEDYNQSQTHMHPLCNSPVYGCQLCANSNASCCTGHIVSSGYNETCPCRSCWDSVKDIANEAIKAAGGVGLFFSFTEVLGVWLAFRFRNQKDPSADPNAFL